MYKQKLSNKKSSEAISKKIHEYAVKNNLLGKTKIITTNKIN